jgi:hypothetical protein
VNTLRTPNPMSSTSSLSKSDHHLTTVNRIICLRPISGHKCEKGFDHVPFLSRVHRVLSLSPAFTASRIHELRKTLMGSMCVPEDTDRPGRLRSVWIYPYAPMKTTTGFQS